MELPARSDSSRGGVASVVELAGDLVAEAEESVARGVQAGTGLVGPFSCRAVEAGDRVGAGRALGVKASDPRVWPRRSLSAPAAEAFAAMTDSEVAVISELNRQMVAVSGASRSATVAAPRFVTSVPLRLL